jgi:hypothetical protein
MVEPLRHRQTKGAATEMPGLPPPRHIPTLPPEHRCGDVWTGLSSMGLLGSKPLAGVVVTPACDLSQQKTETITILPLVPFRAYFSTAGVLSQIRAKIEGSFTAGRFRPELDWGPYEFRPPPTEVLKGAYAAIEAHISAKRLSTKDSAALDRTLAGLRIVLAIADPELHEISASDLSGVFGPEWNHIKSRIITNSYSSNIHFLPSDEQELPFSGLQSHSIVLFRYPITLPIEVLDIARDSSLMDWETAVRRHACSLPMIRMFAEEMPIKTLSLRGEFLADLLTRYVSVYTSPIYEPGKYRF